MADSGVQAPLFRIGEWTFSPAGNELYRGDTRRKLEHRAARTLELLCRRSGAIVSQEEIVDEVWSGRSVSPNSIPVVIRDLRQALDDDAREPRFIETVAKRGYRMLLENGRPRQADVPPVPEVDEPKPVGLRLALGLVALLAIFVLVWLQGSAARGRTILVVTDVVNATGSDRYQPLAEATSSVILGNIRRLKDVEVVRNPVPGNEPAGSIRIGARLTLWTGNPTVMVTAQDSRGSVLWSKMTMGGESNIPRQIADGMPALQVALARRERSGGS